MIEKKDLKMNKSDGNVMTNDKDKPKRKRGRPPKKPVEVPELKTDEEIRNYLVNSSLELTIHLKDNAIKKNNIKNAQITRAKTNQYKLALEAIDTTSRLLKDKQEIELQKRLAVVETALEVAKLNKPDEEKKLIRNGITPSLRVNVLDRDDYTCQMCGATREDGAKLHVDHKIPVAHGGDNDLDNLQTLCSECNIGKGARLDLKCTQNIIQTKHGDEK